MQVKKQAISKGSQTNLKKLEHPRNQFVELRHYLRRLTSLVECLLLFFRMNSQKPRLSIIFISRTPTIQEWKMVLFVKVVIKSSSLQKHSRTNFENVVGDFKTHRNKDLVEDSISSSHLEFKASEDYPIWAGHPPKFSQKSKSVLTNLSPIT